MSEHRAVVLVVEDDEVSRSALELCLLEEGFRVELAVDGHEALARLDAERFDLVLLDIIVPELSGLEVLHATRSRHPITALPIIMVSSLDEGESAAQALQDGANDCITKPIDSRVVLARVETQLALKRARDEVESLADELAKKSRSIPERLQGLTQVCVALMQTVDPDEVIEQVLSVGHRLLCCEGCSLALHDEGRDELVFNTMVGATNTDPFRILTDRGIAGYSFRTGEALRVNDVRSDPRFFSGVDEESGFQTRSVLCSPVMQRGRIFGVVEAVNSQRSEGFTTEDLEILTAFAAIAGAALTRSHIEAAIHHEATVLRDETARRFRMVESEAPAMREVFAVLRRVAPTRATVLLLGDSGTGKEVMARELHRLGPRGQKPFVAVNCVALSPTLLESELFGHEKGAFTGAQKTKKGRFELAHGGTLLLDEIGDLSADLQAKLLRVLQEREVERVGGSKPIRIDVRLVAATNRDLETAVDKGTFREDLYYRLNVVTLKLPPLRERLADIPALANYLLERTAVEIKRPHLSIAPEAMELLKAYHWPGNIRQLGNVLERAAVLCPDTMILPRDLPPEVSGEGAPGALLNGETRGSTGAAPLSSATSAGLSPPDGTPLSDQVAEFKRQRVEEAIALADGNRTQAAQLLGLHQSNLSRLMRTLGMR
jgi:Nif-specific regulatory protein